jgi:hypothetical protein
MYSRGPSTSFDQHAHMEHVGSCITQGGQCRHLPALEKQPMTEYSVYIYIARLLYAWNRPFYLPSIGRRGGFK